MPGATNALGFPLLTIILALPAAAAILSTLLEDDRMARLLAIGATVVDFALAMILLAKFEIRPSGGSPWMFQFADKHEWVSTLGINYWLGVDGVAVFLVGLTTLISAIAVIASAFMVGSRFRLFTIFMLFLETAALGVFMSLNLFLFFVFWEAMLIPAYFLLGMWGEERRIYATTKFLIYTVFGSFLMLVGIIYLWSQTGTLDMVGPNGLVAHPVSETAQMWLFLAFGLAFAIKLPIWPFHSWAPTAYSEAPVPFLLLLAGIMSKAGAFGFIRYALPLFPAATRNYQGMVSILCIIGMLYAAGMALVQTDAKRLVAYASISHMNLIALGIFALNSTGLDGSVLQMINHSVIIVGLFLAVAYIAARQGTRLLSQMGGLGARWPVLMWLFFIFVLAGLDLPGLGSFSGEFLILAGVFKSNAWYSAIAALTIILAAWYMIRMFQQSMNGPEAVSPPAESDPADDVSRTAYEYPVRRRLIGRDLLPREILLFLPLIGLILYIGVQPDGLTTRMNATTDRVTTIVQPPPAGHTTTLGGGR
jgi:NADH-quinone oxidoreductase subunit M